MHFMRPKLEETYCFSRLFGQYSQIHVWKQTPGSSVNDQEYCILRMVNSNTFIS